MTDEEYDDIINPTNLFKGLGEVKEFFEDATISEIVMCLPAFVKAGNPIWVEWMCWRITNLASYKYFNQ